MMRLGVCTIISASFLAASCSSGVSDADIERYCDAICGKQEECNFLFNQTRAGCTQTCVANSRRDDNNDNEPDCEPNKSDVDACIDDVSGLQCSAFTTGMIPASCERICPDDNNNNNNNNNNGFDAGTGGGTDAGGGPGGADCTALATCCGQLPANAQTGCNAVVTNGDNSNCATSLAQFRAGNLCQ